MTRDISSTSNPHKEIAVLIAGIGGGSLGLEIFKSLRYAGGYRLIGTDVSKRAFGLQEDGFDKTYLLKPDHDQAYAQQLLEICHQEKIDAVAPGAEAVHCILSEYRHLFEAQGLLLMLNSKAVINLCANKNETLRYLSQQGIPTLRTLEANSPQEIEQFNCFPCVVKPATGATGGSNLVFLAEDAYEATFFVQYLQRRGAKATLQEYITSSTEFTVGVLSAPSGEILGSIALQRLHEQKLSYILRYEDRVISSGWSQGIIDDFSQVCQQAEHIATAIKSQWALNIQGRLDKQGQFYPFEINPRHSGTTYLRTLAGFNDPHLLIQWCLFGQKPKPSPLKKGYYLRAFTEKYVPAEFEKL